MGEPHARPEEPEVLQILQWAPPESLHAERFLVRGLGDVGVQAHAQAAGQIVGLLHQSLAGREW